MCTIMSMDATKFRANQEAVLKQIRTDFQGNGHGSSLILQGATEKDTSLARSLNVEHLIAMLVATEGWQRFWFHNRYATTTFKGLTGAHGFHARHGDKDYYVMHNGTFRHKEAEQFNVDSEWLASLTRRYGPEAALGVINKNEYFANCFLICPTEGEWYMSRASSGGLYTDGTGNFSTNQVLDITQVVPDRSLLKFNMTVARSYTTYNTGRSTYQGGGHSQTGNGSATPPATTTPPATSSSYTGPLALGPNQLTEGKWVKQGMLWKRKAGDVIYVTGKTPTDAAS